MDFTAYTEREIRQIARDAAKRDDQATRAACMNELMARRAA